ncbi:hypothetical protein ATCR1_17148, partial [Agrobacterium tumefaciens CCNWGS0286]
MGQLVGPVQEAVQIVIILAAGQAIIGCLLAGGLLDIFGARTSVVGADFLAAETTEKLGDRLVGGLAENIPQRALCVAERPVFSSSVSMSHSPPSRRAETTRVRFMIVAPRSAASRALRTTKRASSTQPSEYSKAL